MNKANLIELTTKLVCSAEVREKLEDMDKDAVVKYLQQLSTHYDVVINRLKVAPMSEPNREATHALNTLEFLLIDLSPNTDWYDLDPFYPRR